MTQADWDRLDKLTDQEIEAAVASDPDAAPIADEKFWKNARLVAPAKKLPTSIRLDPYVLTWFRSFGKGYQTRINAVLHSYIDAKRRERERASKR